MRELPILFSTEMVQAILDDRKSMTRRVVKGLPDDQSGCDLGIIKTSSGELTGYGFEEMPYQPGDILWVRETWAFIDNLGAGVGDNQYYEYKADTNNPLPGNWPIEEKAGTCLRWKPSIHMPKTAARIWLEVTNVRVERLQDITPNDIAAEGLPSYIIPPGHKHYNNVCGEKWLGYEWFRDLWDSFNSKRGYGWETNPWVWVVEFRRIAP